MNEKAELKQIFESDRIIFVEVSETLAKDYLVMVNDDEHVNLFIGGRYGGSREPYTEAQEIEWVQKKLADKTPVFSMIEKATGAFIGNIELMDVHDGCGELGIALTAAKQDQGFGTEGVQAFTKYAFDEMGLQRVFLRTNLENARAFHVYQKCGFREFKRTQEHICMEIYRDKKMDDKNVVIRLEEEKDHRAVENLIRESFWNVYKPGCSEHFVMHVLRDDPAFIPELDFVMENDGELIGQNMFMKTVIDADDGRTIDVLTMGPICITPALKRRGYGKILLDYSLEKAAEMGFGAVLFEGNIQFYGKSGLEYARNFGIRYHDLPEGEDDSFFLCKELIPGYLADVTGVYQTPQGYYVADEDVEEFDKDFPPKVKLKLPGQLFS